MLKASLILIGSELFEFKKEERNSKSALDFFNKKGIEVSTIQIVEDKIDSIKKAFENALTLSEIVVSSGGLGPTGDDLTREGLSAYLQKDLEFDNKWLKEIDRKLKIRRKRLSDVDSKMALIPKGGKIIPNKYGLAGGIHFQKDGKEIFCLPGVPSEFNEMFENYVKNVVDKKFKTKNKSELKVLFSAIRESEIQEYLKKFDESKNIKYSILPHFGVINLNFIFSREINKKEVKKEIRERFGKNVISFKGESLVEKIKREMEKKNYFLSVAESLTGGNISKKIVTLSGVSNFFKGSVVAYSNEAKVDLLGVPQKYIKKYGAVSEKVALSMAQGVRARFLTECAIATTGIAGPTGGSKNKPLGLVFIAVSKPKKERIYKYIFPLSREGVIEMTSNYALFHLFKLLRDED